MSIAIRVMILLSCACFAGPAHAGGAKPFAPKRLFPAATKLGQLQRQYVLDAAAALRGVKQGTLRAEMPNRDRSNVVLKHDVTADLTSLVAEMNAFRDEHLASTRASAEPLRATQPESAAAMYLRYAAEIDAKATTLFGPFGMTWSSAQDSVGPSRQPQVYRTVTEIRPPAAMVHDDRVAPARRMLERAKQDPAYGRKLSRVMGDTAALARFLTKARSAQLGSLPRAAGVDRALFHDLIELVQRSSNKSFFDRTWGYSSEKLVSDAVAEAQRLTHE